MLRENGEEESAMVQCTVLDGVVKFGNLIATIKRTNSTVFRIDRCTHSGRIKLLLLDATKVFEELLPAFPEEPRLVAATPSVLNFVNIQRLEVLRHNVLEVAQQHDDLLVSLSIFKLID